MNKLVLASLLLTGCYGPSYKDCEVTCASGNGCPSGLSCDDTLGVCRTSGHGVACGSSIDDVPGDVVVDSDQTCWPYAPTNYAPCAADFPPALDYTLGSGSLDTDTGTFPNQPGVPNMTLGTVYLFNGSRVRLLHATSFSIGTPATTVSVRGALPLLIVSESTVSIVGALDATGANTTPTGACDAGVGMGITQGSTGGGGGGFASGGGSGGTTTASSFGGTGGSRVGTDTQVPLVAGCPGADGGTPDTTVIPGGSHGGGGGAIEIAARGSITIQGRVLASGGGGGAGQFGGPAICPNGCTTGGGGAGAGGAVFLEASTIAIESGAQVCATGGGGGQGATNQTGLTSKPGSNGSCTAGIGGNGNNVAGVGGAGSSMPGTPGALGKSPPGGGLNASGGGGGGAGRIRIHAVTTPTFPANAVIVPMPM